MSTPKQMLLASALRYKRKRFTWAGQKISDRQMAELIRIRSRWNLPISDLIAEGTAMVIDRYKTMDEQAVMHEDLPLSAGMY
jgi:hypothetical protein